VRTLTSEVLSEHGFVCMQAGDAEEALHLVDGRLPSIAVLDIGLPGRSGAELAWRMRERGHTFPIVAVSGQLSSWDPDDLADLGFDGVFAKPFDEDELVSRCLELLRARDEADTGPPA
jgi:DNA-binding response OmpR family regulator